MLDDRVTIHPPLPVLVFDGECGFCTTCARLLHRWVIRHGSPSVAPWQRLDLGELHLSAEQCAEAVQWVGEDGQVASGHAAIASALRAGRPVWRPVGTLLLAPGFSWLAARLYSWVAAHRDALPGGTPACAVVGDTPKGRSEEPMVEPDPLSGHVHIRAVEDGDLEPFFEDQLDPEATRMAAFVSRDRTAFMAHWAKIRTDQSGLSRTIVVGGHVAGNLVSWDESGHREVGYWIGHDFWNRGIATEALILFLAHESVRPLHAYVAVHNAGSIRVLEKCGFQPVAAGDIPPSTAVDGEVEHLVFVLES